ncbi:translation protein SH3-like domain-containing protein [Plectosphaerella cucumerina]|uniref:Translation protein SH3-like domain-containing protein n=1 Tax=Plectosphaerella cucumerina TaxID=40658 RepID=A0A8K0TB45_9PEZI|nr:translation protein SH3-like domain-containing protein [Plectosphaerella cucumerina]
MNTSSLWRPLGCLKTALRQTRQNRVLQRSMATAVDATPSAPATPPPSKPASTRPPGISYHRHFALPNPLPTIRSTFPDPIPALTAKQIARLDPTGARTALFDRARPDAAKVGDVLLVTLKHGEPFAGVCLSIRRRGVDTAILLRNQLMRVGVETWHKIYAPSVAAIDIVWRRPKRARRARLTYMRQPKHDMGSVAHLVSAWRKERMSMRNKGKGLKGGHPGRR